MQPLDLAILALRLALVVLLYAFLLLVLRAARAGLDASSVDAYGVVAARGSAAGAAHRPLRLVVVDAGETGLRTGDLLEAPSGTVLGRGGRSTLILADPTVSTEHAEVQLVRGRWTVRDLGSTNGTLVNEVRVDGPVQLEPGDLLRLGSIRVKLARA